jgi:hypothetical protein
MIDYSRAVVRTTVIDQNDFELQPVAFHCPENLLMQKY